MRQGCHDVSARTDATRDPNDALITICQLLSAICGSLRFCPQTSALQSPVSPERRVQFLSLVFACLHSFTVAPRFSCLLTISLQFSLARRAALFPASLCLCGNPPIPPNVGQCHLTNLRTGDRLRHSRTTPSPSYRTIDAYRTEIKSGMMFPPVPDAQGAAIRGFAMATRDLCRSSRPLVRLGGLPMPTAHSSWMAERSYL